MRIINDYNLNNSKEVKLSKLGNVKVGDLLNAKIVEVHDNKIIAEIKGKLVLLNNLLELNLVEGEGIELEVASQKNGKVYARPTNIAFKEELNMEMLSHELKNLGLEVTDKHIKVLNFFKENNILFNKTELKEVLDNIKFIEKLIDQIEKGNVNLKILDINNNLREELVKIITSNLSEKVSKTQNVLPKETIDVLKALLQGQEGKEKNENPIQGEKHKSLLAVEKNINNKEDISHVIKDNTLSSQKEVEGFIRDQIKSTLTNQLKGFELDAILFLVKEKFDINLSNLILSNNFFSEGKNIGESLDKIVALLENTDSITPSELETVFKEVLSMKTLDTSKIDLLIEKLFNKPQGEMTFEERESFKGVKEELIFVKKMNDFNLELNQKINYYQFSLQSNNRFSDVEFFVNKDSHQKKNHKKNFKVFVSLQTKNLDRVKAIVELKKKDLSITFITKSDDYEKKLEGEVTQLRNSIEAIGFDQVNIKFTQQRKESSKKDFLLDVMSSKIDMRV